MSTIKEIPFAMMTASVQKPQRNMLLVTKVAEIVSFESLVSENITVTCRGTKRILPNVTILKWEVHDEVLR